VQIETVSQRAKATQLLLHSSPKNPFAPCQLSLYTDPKLHLSWQCQPGLSQKKKDRKGFETELQQKVMKI